MTKIEWTERTWNPIVGCSLASPGCTHCYAMRIAARIERMGSAPHYAGTTRKVKGNAVWTGKIARAPMHILREPLERKKPTTFFVNSMGDLFHEATPLDAIADAFLVMAQCPQHTFQVLTKRSGVMRQVMNDAEFREDVEAGLRIIDEPNAPPLQWPLPNVWLGVSAERQQEADERIPDLLATPAAVRFVSAEPLLGPIDFGTIVRAALFEGRLARDGHVRPLDWIIVGGESGPEARPMQAEWARSIRDQCQAAGVAFFFKQWGNHRPTSDADGPYMMRVARKAEAGRQLDGREWNEMPERAKREARSHAEESAGEQQDQQNH